MCVLCNNHLMKHQSVAVFAPDSAADRPPLDALPVFLAVAHLQSFSAAAKVMRVDRSRVSRVVAELEARLGVPLFSRTTRQVRLTPEGLELQERVRPAMAALIEAFAHVGDLAAHTTGVVSLTTSPDLARHLIAPLLPGFRQANPTIRVELHTSEAVLDLTEQGIDLALRLGRPGRASGVARKLTTIPAAFFAAPSYLERRGIPRALGELSHHETL
ncbi:MAG TPA: LysR family transcriptional regulator, partial [Myxococcota bacterium]|nr:LysR family transcriptional regulator [Myxococcota bacterium]